MPKPIHCILIVILIFATLSCSSTETTEFGAMPISSEAFFSQIKDKRNIKIIDVRTPEEFIQMKGPDASNIPLSEFHDDPKMASLKMDGISKKDKLYLICNDGGQRSKKVNVILRRLGYEKSFYVEGGVLEFIKNESKSKTGTK